MRTERWLRIIGLCTWLVAGSTSFVRLARDPRGAPVWIVAYLAFGALFWAGSHRRASRARKIACLAAQAVLAVLLAVLGMSHFEGALLALVAAQAALVLPLWAAVLFAVVQVGPLWLSIAGAYAPVDVAKSITSYLGFAGFALGIVHLFEAERRARVELALAEERVRIARELHDVLGHHLTALTIHLDLARRTAGGESSVPLGEAHATAQRTLAEVREVVHRMGRGTIDLRGELEKLVRVPELEVALDYPSSIALGDPALSHVVLRCVQEALTNARRHAGAKHVRVTLELDGGDLVVCVRDDGTGVSELRPGHGLGAMRERVEKLGGRLDVTSSPDGGTTVSARLPIREG